MEVLAFFFSGCLAPVPNDRQAAFNRLYFAKKKQKAGQGRAGAFWFSTRFRIERQNSAAYAAAVGNWRSALRHGLVRRPSGPRRSCGRVSLAADGITHASRTWPQSNSSMSDHVARAHAPCGNNRWSNLTLLYFGPKVVISNRSVVLDSVKDLAPEPSSSTAPVPSPSPVAAKV
jgi:hypothetical protein